jgi:hypothetical protein
MSFYTTDLLEEKPLLLIARMELLGTKTQRAAISQQSYTSYRYKTIKTAIEKF